jgi:hypothetical protein
MSPTPATSASADSHDLLVRIVEMSKRSSVQLPVRFVRAELPPPPLVQMLRGGQGGEIRLKLYLTLTLLATKPPHRITREISARTWAEMLGVPDPEVNGARRVRDALTWLHEHHFVKVDRHQGRPPQMQLLDPVGSGGAYRRPSTPWVSLPVSYWTEQWITRLSGTATALLIILIDLTSGKRRLPVQSLTGEEKRRYGLSADSWTRATAELVGQGLITVGRSTAGRGLEWKRNRNTYGVNFDTLKGLQAE